MKPDPKSHVKMIKVSKFFALPGTAVLVACGSTTTTDKTADPVSVVSSLSEDLSTPDALAHVLFKAWLR